MQNVRIAFIRGPLTGQSSTFEVGHLVIGRQPGPEGLELKNANKSVSRQHAELREVENGVELNNLSPNGAQVNGKIVLNTQNLQSGDEITVGDSHVFSVNWESFVTTRSPEADQKPEEKSNPGLLASPVVRAFIGAYLLAMVAAAVWLTGSDSATTSADDWPALQAAYEVYQAEQIPEEERAARMQRAQLLLRRVRALKTQGRYNALEPLCREIMAVDSEIGSPLFLYGAQCLADASIQG